MATRESKYVSDEDGLAMDGSDLTSPDDGNGSSFWNYNDHSLPDNHMTS